MSRRILIVDDHAATRALVRAVLQLEKQEKYELEEAGTGAECLMAVEKKGPFDLILLDVELPDMDGYAICRAIRKAGHGMPVVFVTSRTQLKDFQQGRDAGGDSYVVKPINRSALKSIVGVFTTVARKGTDVVEDK
jgi:CheY-like chemotaxis protein